MGIFSTILQKVKGSVPVAVPGFLPYVNEWQRVDWQDWTTTAQLEGSRKSAAVLQCVAKLVLAYPEAPLKLYNADDDEVVSDHPLLDVLSHPNPFMSFEELQQITMMYLAIGGNAYWHLVRSKATGEIIQLWPKHAGVMWPAPSKSNYIDHYKYSIDGTKPHEIPTTDVAHFRWPLIDPLSPWLGLAPLVAIGREVQLDSEARRFCLTMLKNDAVVRGVLQDKKGLKNDQQKEYFKQQLEKNYGGDNRGKTMILDGYEYKRIGFDMNELAFDALHRVPEARIAGGFLMDVIFAGLTAGMDASTYSNRQGARQFFYEDTMVKLWRLQAGTITRALLPLDAGLYFWHVTKDVIALRSDQTALVNRVHTMLGDNAITKAEARAMLDLPPLEKEEIAPNELRSTGIGVERFTALITAYTMGQVPREAAVAVAREFYGFDEATAAEFFPEGAVVPLSDNAIKALLAKAFSNGHSKDVSLGGDSDPFTHRTS